MSLREGATVAFYTLGCKVNQSESHQLARDFEALGWDVVDFSQPASVYVINTCTVTQVADQKSRKMIRNIKKNHPESRVVVTGCYVNSGADLLENMAEVDHLFDNQSKKHLAQDMVALLALEVEGCRSRDVQGSWDHRTRATLKIQEGCRQFCTYCIIPYVRGGWQSQEPQDVLRQARELAQAGYGEIVLLGIHLGAYGWERGEKEGLSQLLELLLTDLPQVRFRLGSIEPLEVTPRLIQVMKSHANVCPHLHLPLQYGENGVLKAMNRPYDTRAFRAKVAEIRQALPDVALTTDVMVGFPGESQDIFQTCLNFVEEMAFARLHVFAYSRRPGTPAADLPDQVPQQTKVRRSQTMVRLGEVLTRRYVEGCQGQIQEVLVEDQLSPGLWKGHTAHYLEVVFPHEGMLQKGRRCLVRIPPDPQKVGGLWRVNLVEADLSGLGGNGIMKHEFFEKGGVEGA